jgi:23S rRNA C2498 (ribose-2'-O)-methylase RlmM
VADKIPNMILVIDPKIKSRFEAYASKTLAAEIVVTSKYPELVFMKTPLDSERAVQIIWEDTSVSRYVHNLFSVTSWSRTLDELRTQNFTGKTLRVAGYPKTAVKEAVACLEPNPTAKLQPANYTHALHVVQAYNRYYLAVVESKAHYGFFKGQDTKAPKPAEDSLSATSVTRAAHKLEELFRSLNYRPPPTFRALDVGACPGGWSLVLHQLGAYVVAVDPGEIPALHGLANVTHLKCRLEHCESELRQLAPFDLCVCDINIDGRDACTMVVERCAELMATGALLVVTLKLFNGANSARLKKGCLNTITACGLFERVNVEWLFSNGQERTLTALRNANHLAVTTLPEVTATPPHSLPQ